MSEHAFRKISRRSGSRRESGETLPIEAWKGSSKFSSKKTASRPCCCPYGPLPSSQHHLQQQPALSPAAGVVVVAATAELIFRFRELGYQSQVQQTLAMLLLMAAPLLLLLWSWLVQQQARNGGRFFFFNIYVSFLPDVALHNSCFVLLRSMSGAAASASYIPA